MARRAARRSSRRWPGLALLGRGVSWTLLTIVVATLVVGATLVVRLPEIVRRVVVTELTRRSGRTVVLDDVDINPFTTHVALKRFRMTRPGASAPEIEFERLDARLAPWALLWSDIRLRELALEAPTIRSDRIGPTRFGFTDLLELIPPGDPNRPSKWTFTLDRLRIARGTLVGRDRMTTPHTSWRIDNLAVDGGIITTRTGAAPARLTATALLNGTHTEADIKRLRLSPFSTAMRVKKAPFPVTQFVPYLPSTVPVLPRAGSVSWDLEIALDRETAGIRRGFVAGDIGLTGLEVIERKRPDPFLTLARLSVRIKHLDLVSQAIILDTLDLDGVDLRASRDRAGRLHLVDLEPAGASPASGATPPPATPARKDTPAGPGREVRVERLTVNAGTVRFVDEAVAPPREWRLEHLTVNGGRLSTVASDGPGRLQLTAQLRPASASRGAAVSVRADDVRLLPASASATASVARLDLRHIDPYVPPSVDVATRSGSADLSLKLAFEQGPRGLKKGVVSGDLRVARLALEHRKDARPLATLGRLLVALTRADLVKRDVSLGAIDIDGLRLHAVRNPHGQVDLLAVVADTPSSSPPTSDPRWPAAPPATARAASADFKLELRKLQLSNSAIRFRDEAVSPGADLELTDLAVVVRSLSWPTRGPATFETAMTLPGQGRLQVKGEARLQPPAANFAMTMRGAVIEPFQPYLPFAARITGVFNGDSQNALAVADGRITARSTGHSWIDKLELHDPDDEVPPVRIERLDLAGIDFAWPKHAKAEKVTITKPELHVVRDADGVIRLRKLLDTRQKMGAGVPPANGSSGAAAPVDAGGETRPAATDVAAGSAARPEREPQSVTPPAGLPPAGAPEPAPAVAASPHTASPAAATPRAEPDASPPIIADAVAGIPSEPAADRRPFPLEFEFGTILIEDAYARFLDRTTKPAFSEALSKLTMTVDGLSSAPGERATVAARGLLGEQGGLDLRGEIAPLGDELFADLSLEVRDFSLPDVNPYADKHISWIITKGTLAARVRYTIEGDTLTAANDVVVGSLEVKRSEASDEVKRRIGLPLGLIVALVKDLNGDIKLNVPITGSLKDPKFDWSDAIWTAVKNVLVNVVVAPFKAIGKLFTKGDRIESVSIDPVPFAPGRAVVGPAVERQLTSVADFLRKSPFVKVALAPVATSGDVDGLRAQALAARLQRLQRERKVSEYSEVVEAVFREEFPDQKPEPETDERRLAMLAARETVPEGAVDELLKRRLEAVRENLVKTEGIQADRLLVEDSAGSVQDSGDGRVEFHLR